MNTKQLPVSPEASSSGAYRSPGPQYWVWFSALLALVVVWSFIVVPSWLRGEWDPSNKVMRYLYQCQGTPEQETVRWEPRRLLVSACKQPILIAESDNNRRVLILNRADAQYVVLDPEAGQIVYSVSARDYFVRSLVGDKYLYARAAPRQAGLPQVDYMIDVDTGVSVPMTQIAWEINDVTPLVQAYERSRGNVIRVNGAPQALLFIHATNEFAAYELTTPIPAIVNDLINGWSTSVLKAYKEIKLNASVAGGDEDCLVGENKYIGDNNPISLPGRTFCLFRFALPVVANP